MLATSLLSWNMLSLSSGSNLCKGLCKAKLALEVHRELRARSLLSDSIMKSRNDPVRTELSLL